MGPREPYPRPLPRLDRALWTWRLSGKAGGTGHGFAVEYKTRPAVIAERAGRARLRARGWATPLVRQNPRLDDHVMQASRNAKGTPRCPDPALSNPTGR